MVENTTRKNKLMQIYHRQSGFAIYKICELSLPLLLSLSRSNRKCFVLFSHSLVIWSHNETTKNTRDDDNDDDDDNAKGR